MQMCRTEKIKPKKRWHNWGLWAVWPDGNFFLNIWPFLTMKICPIAQNTCQHWFSICRKFSKNYQRLSKFCQIWSLCLWDKATELFSRSRWRLMNSVGKLLHLQNDETIESVNSWRTTTKFVWRYVSSSLWTSGDRLLIEPAWLPCSLY